MKGVYWRPRKISRRALAALTLASMVGMGLIEGSPKAEDIPYRREKLTASQLAAQGMDLLKAKRLERGYEIIPQFDPAETGLIGQSMSPVTSVPGNLSAKQTSINPNFAAVIVQMLRESGVQQGDLVAVGCSGSFPALNLCVYAALETLQAKPVIIASASASQFGANIPDLMWMDMERELRDAGLISFHAVAGSYGGYEDRGLGMSAESRGLVRQALERNHLTVLESDSLEEAIEARMAIYDRESAGGTYKAYINVGGGATSVGRTEGKLRYEPGMNDDPTPEALAIDSVMTRFAQEGVPLIHLVEIKELAQAYGLPEAPHSRPAPGTGGIFVKREYDRTLAALLLGGITITLLGFVRTGFRRPLARLAVFLELHRPHPGPRLAQLTSEQKGELMV